MMYRRLFDDKSEGVDLEDSAFRGNLHKTMLAVAIGEPVSALLAKINPSFSCAVSGNVWDANKGNWLDCHWMYICSEIWSYYAGSFGAFLAMRNAGLSLILSGGIPNSSEDAFRSAFRLYKYVGKSSVFFVVSSMIFVRKEL